MDTTSQKCPDHDKLILFMCLPRDKVIEQKYMCEDCKVQNKHNLPRQSIVAIEDVRSTLTNKWGQHHTSIASTLKEVNSFYQNLSGALNKQLEKDKALTIELVERLGAFGLPFDVDVSSYNHFMHNRLDLVDCREILKMMEAAEETTNKHSKGLESILHKQNEILNTLKLELKKVNEKVLTLKYILLGKKLETEFLIPQLEGESKIGGVNQFARLGGLFNSRGKMIRALRLEYRGSEHAFKSESFAKKCSDVRNFVALAKLDNGKIVGGYSPVRLVDNSGIPKEGESENCALDISRSSFLFSLSNIKSYSVKGDKCLEYAKIDQNLAGPKFGKDLVLGNEVTSELGNFYELNDNIKGGSLEAQAALLQSSKAKLQEIEIWRVAF